MKILIWIILVMILGLTACDSGNTSLQSGSVSSPNEIGICKEYCDGNYIYKEYGQRDDKGIHCSSGNTNLSKLDSMQTPFHISVYCD